MDVIIKKYTLVFIRKDSQILLGYKKRGFGQGRWNGFGGKVELDESIEDAAIRELKEECNLIADKSSLKKVAVLTFKFQELDEKVMEVHVFSSSLFEGEIKESDEMQPKWFNIEEIPFDKMWPDDKIWFPLFLSDKQFVGQFLFKDLEVMISHSIELTTFE